MSVALGSAWLTLVVTLLGLLGGLWWAFDLLAHFRLQYSFVALLIVGASAAVRSKAGGLVAALALLINSVLLAPALISPDVARSPGPAEITVMSLNAWRQNFDPTSVVETVDQFRPDLALLLEVTPPVADRVRRIEDYRGFEAAGGLLLIRRTPDIRVLNLDANPLPGVRSVVANLVVGNRPVTLIGSHLPAPNSPRSARRAEQASQALAEFIAQQAGSVIVLGDFNATPWSHRFQSLRDAGGLLDSSRGFGLQPTWPYRSPWVVTFFLRIPIDHCLHTPDLRTIERVAGPPGSSNHRPLFIRLAFGPG